MHKELWEQIVVVHNTNKALFIWCEENGIQLKSFLQPNNELKNAWEHVIRAKAEELGLTSKPQGDKYIKFNLEKVLSHEYRAFFDICDWLSMTLRKRLLDLLEPYDHETINAVIQTYYSQLRPRMDKFCTEIAALRTSKDISMEGNVLTCVKDYNTIITQLIDEVQSVSASIPALEDYKARKAAEQHKATMRIQRWGLIKGVILIVVGILIGWYVKWATGAKP